MTGLTRFDQRVKANTPPTKLPTGGCPHNAALGQADGRSAFSSLTCRCFVKASNSRKNVRTSSASQGSIKHGHGQSNNRTTLV